ncbi:zinc finger BED domain-containing protein 5-like [Centruroides vittatus]|uniref:zinc finger BED domain-containing protein 5-like n=1 Tax=Centruroides vittatus TaxID=120091 RepID=UPI00350FF7A5
MKSTYTTPRKELLQASLKVSYRTAWQGEAHATGENLTKPCVIDICQTLFIPKEVTNIKQLPLFNDTVKRQISLCANDHLNELLWRMKMSSYFTLQLDESTDVSGLAVLLVFVKYQYNDELCKDLLMCNDLKNTTTGCDIFYKIDDFIQSNEIDWKKCIDICTDGAKAMQGPISGVVVRIKVAHPSCSSSHCILHRENLAVKNIPRSLKDIFKALTNIVNYFVKKSLLNTRLLKQICTEMGSDYDCLLFYIEVRWLSQGKVLMRIYELHSEVLASLNEHKSEAQKKSTKEKIQLHIDFMISSYTLQGVAYLCDIFDKLNAFSLSLQGKNNNIFTANDKISAFKMKISMWKKRYKAEEFEIFDKLSSYLLGKKILVDTDLKKAIIQHLEDLLTLFKNYFPDNNEIENYVWIVNPFSTNKKIIACQQKKKSN